MQLTGMGNSSMVTAELIAMGKGAWRVTVDPSSQRLQLWCRAPLLSGAPPKDRCVAELDRTGRLITPSSALLLATGGASAADEPAGADDGPPPQVTVPPAHTVCISDVDMIEVAADGLLQFPPGPSVTARQPSAPPVGFVSALPGAPNGARFRWFSLRFECVSCPEPTAARLVVRRSSSPSDPASAWGGWEPASPQEDAVVMPAIANRDGDSTVTCFTPWTSTRGVRAYALRFASTAGGYVNKPGLAIGRVWAAFAF